MLDGGRRRPPVHVRILDFLGKQRDDRPLAAAHGEVLLGIHRKVAAADHVELRQIGQRRSTRRSVVRASRSNHAVRQVVELIELICLRRVAGDRRPIADLLLHRVRRHGGAERTDHLPDGDRRQIFRVREVRHTDHEVDIAMDQVFRFVDQVPRSVNSAVFSSSTTNEYSGNPSNAFSR